MAAIILNESTVALSVTKVYQERLKRSAELVAKKELVSLSTAIDSAAVKGLDNLSFKLSSAVTKLAAMYHDIAIGIIENDISEAGYKGQRVIDSRSGAITGYNISWAEEEEVTPVDPDPTPVNPDPNQGGGEQGGNDNPTGGDNTPTGGDDTPTGGDDNQGSDDTPVVTPAEDQNAEHYVVLEAADVTGQSPAANGWFEKDGNDQFIVSTDAEADAEKTYYRAKTEEELNPADPEPIPEEPVNDEPEVDQNLDHYDEVDFVGGTENPSALGWYEIVDDQIVLSADTVADVSKTYLTLKTEWEPVDPADLDPDNP